MKNAFALLALALTLSLASISAPGQYPAKPVHLVVPFAAGGASDTAARTLGQALSKSLGQSIVIDNKPGANGAIAAQAVLGAAPDGYTLLWGVGSLAGLPLLMKNPPFESLTDFTPISLVGQFAFAMFVYPGVPAKSVAELISYARANPEKLSYASSTISEHLAASQFMNATGITMVRVPYKGGAQAMPDLVAGRVQVYITPISLGLPYVKDGRLRILATLLPKRSAAAPDVPTMVEAGFPRVSVPTWQAVFAPSKTPREIAEHLSRSVSSVLQESEVRLQFDRQTLHVEGSTPEVLTASIKGEIPVWAQFVRENGITQE